MRARSGVGNVAHALRSAAVQCTVQICVELEPGFATVTATHLVSAQPACELVTQGERVGAAGYLLLSSRLDEAGFRS
jgi:hypothetical protein